MIQKCSTWKVLSEFLKDPQKKHQIRGISKDIKLSTTSVKLHINKLIKAGLIVEKKDIFKYYIANFDNPKFRFYKKIDTLLKIEDSEILEYLNDILSPNTIILFGSCAKGEDIYGSDLDLYCQAEEKKLDLKKFEKSLGRKIQLFFSEDLNKLPKELRNNIINGIKLDGYLKVF
ncbi:hypothetical protein GF336_02040 [Candidatus Woesearchaeota archaeon]|nr:hypothetical protein [Candidatus Woesearchaeota archaeon]